MAGAAALGGWAASAGTAVAADLGGGITYSVAKEGKGGGKPKIGDLVAIRFKVALQSSGQVIDDILTSAEPYYYRVGSGQVLPAIEKAVVMMKSGDVYQLTVPPEFGFGTKGRSSSPGKPRIPGTAILDLTLELVAVPGKDEELIDVIDEELL